MKRIVLWGLLGLVLLLVIVVAGGWFYLRTSLPRTSGTVQVSGLDGPVDIVRDADGVPHIFAATDRDAVFALGYVHAQDRLWQMEINRRVGAGRLSEILGEATLNTDKFLRTLGTYRAAEAAWPAFSPEAQTIVQAYVEGINAWLAEGHTLPPEFLILGVKPEPWTPADSLVWAKMMAWDLGGDYDVELLRTRLTQALGPERTAQILPAYPEDGATIVPREGPSASTLDHLLRLDSALKRIIGLRGLDVGSNNWVVAGSRTDTGKPMLANDPHLGARIPSIWYLAEVQGDTLHVIGATLPSLPLFPTGHNERIAWGVTNVGPDVQDLFLERINPANPNQYEVNGEWVNMEIVEEVIRVKGQERPIRWAARSTRHGPLISDVTTTDTPMALRWTALDPGDTTLEAFLGINYAGNWDEFRAALSKYVAPSQNFVYADVDGNIGYLAPGRIPVRSQGEGMFPVPGWTDEYAWTGWIPFDELPQTFNPERGYIVTANNRVVDEDYPYLISNTWAPPFRAQRITDLIEAMSSGDDTLSLADMQTIQLDQVSLQAQELAPRLLEAEAALAAPGAALEGVDVDRLRRALSRLRGWNGQMSRDSSAPAIYVAWVVHLAEAMFGDDLRGDLYEEMATRNHPLFLREVFSQPESYAGWCDNVLSAPQESCADTALLALDAALDDLAERLGDNPDRWQWGEIHQTVYPHTPFSEVDALRPLFERRIPNGGDTYTVNVAPVRLDLETRYQQRWVPSYRHLVDLSDLNRSLFMHTTGQSGNVLSPHYDDLIERHRDGVYLPMSFGRNQSAGDLLRLAPKP